MSIAKESETYQVVGNCKYLKKYNLKKKTVFIFEFYDKLCARNMQIIIFNFLKNLGGGGFHLKLPRFGEYITPYIFWAADFQHMVSIWFWKHTRYSFDWYKKNSIFPKKCFCCYGDQLRHITWRIKWKSRDTCNFSNPYHTRNSYQQKVCLKQVCTHESTYWPALQSWSEIIETNA